MKKILIPILLLALVSCEPKTDTTANDNAATEAEKTTSEAQSVKHETGYNENGGFSTDGAERKEFSGYTAKQVEDVMGFPVRADQRFSYSGYFSLMKVDGELKKHGPFTFSSNDPESGNSIFYKGIYLGGLQHDVWTEKAELNGPKMRESYSTTISFDNGDCKGGNFKGSVHPEMKPVDKSFEGNVCDFELLRKKVESEFMIAYKESMKTTK